MTSKGKRHGQALSPTDSIGLPESLWGEGTELVLRRRAEKVLQDKATLSPKVLDDLSSEEILVVFHELQVHQIELELQNEELQRTQVDLDRARVRYFNLYDLAPVGYCTLSANGLITEANLAVATLLGVARSDLVNQPISRFILKDDQDLYYLYSKQFFTSPATFRQYPAQTGFGQPSASQACELRMVKEDGTEFWMQMRMTAVQDAECASEFRVVLSDISERKRTEAQQSEFDEQKRQIQKAESLRRMAGAIAHLFNNQLYVVLGNLEMALDDMVGNVSVRQKIVKAMQAARRSSEVSGLLLSYLGHNAGKPEILDLSGMCRDNLPRIQAALPDDIAMTVNLFSPGPVIRANANQMLQVLTQLVTNGWEAIGGRAGQVSVTTKVVPLSELPRCQVESTGHHSGAENFACLEVTDTGCGMTPEELDKIFDPFFSTKFTGRGLGLAVAAGLVKAWKGMIGVQSTAGKGSTFRAFFPLVTDAAPRQTANLPEPGDFKTSGRTVLLVDDDYVVRNLVASVLNRLGFSVLAAAGGSEAMALFRRHQGTIDCLITDLCMPGMDGWETLSALRNIQPDLPVILSSGYDETQAMNGDHVERVQGFLHKPYSLDDLRNVLSRVLGARAEQPS